MDQFSSHWKDIHEILYLNIFRQAEFRLKKYDKNY
jgi:hypothetical protein